MAPTTLDFMRPLWHALARRLAVLCVATLATTAGAQVPGRNLTLLAHHDEFPIPPAGVDAPYSSCWSYVHSDGREYALLGVATGTAIYNVTDPANSYRVGFIPGPTSGWREMKSYRNWIYIVTEGRGPGQGLQIVRMTDPEHPVLVRTYTDGFIRSHTVSVDVPRRLLYCNGTWDETRVTGIRVLSLITPENPIEVGRWPAEFPVPDTSYVHDSAPIGTRVYASSIGTGRQRVLDATNPSQLSEIASWTYPGALTHSSWPDPSGRWLYVTDETNGEPLKIFDLADLAAPVLAGSLTPNPQAIVHNAYVDGNRLYLACYTEGIRILDITDPVHPAEFAWADSYAGPSGGIGGVWNVCPYFPSGIVIASDMQSGLYVYRPTFDYGRLRVELADAGLERCGIGDACCCYPDVCTCAGHGSAGRARPGDGELQHLEANPFMVHLVTQGDSLAAPLDGVVQFAPRQGTHTVAVHRFGYFDALATVHVAEDQLTTVQLTMVPRPTGQLSGTVSGEGRAPLPETDLKLVGTPLHASTDDAGNYRFEHAPLGTYPLEIHAPGHRPESFQHSVGPVGTLNISLAPTHTWDAFETATGWIVGHAGDQASAGVWERAQPSGISTPRGPRDILWTPEHDDGGSDVPGPTEPKSDRTPGSGTWCFMTGRNPGTNDPDAHDLDGGVTTLASPPLNLSGMLLPRIGVWVWLFSHHPRIGHPSADDWLAVSISFNGGTSWVPVDTLRGPREGWEELTIPVQAFGVPSSQVRVRFVAADLGDPSIVEMAIDDVTTYDAALPLLEGPREPQRRGPLKAWPLPFTETVAIELDLPVKGRADVTVFDVLGRRIRTLADREAPAGRLRLHWNGVDDDGRQVGAGLYLARATFHGESSWLRLVRTR
ncbi:MAG TPA: choice-of-anchor B family protein [Candidatus Limnocylindria bacterium]|nr:choice-of-anchor B family protein [Candidatus Limnocylindria bacterium]